jgi:hypothetical protein
MTNDAETFRIIPSRTAGVPAVEFSFSVRIECELLEGDPERLAAIAREFAQYIERRDEQMGLLACRDWALLVDRVDVKAAPHDVVDVRGRETHLRAVDRNH